MRGARSDPIYPPQAAKEQRKEAARRPRPDSAGAARAAAPPAAEPWSRQKQVEAELEKALMLQRNDKAVDAAAERQVATALELVAVLSYCVLCNVCVRCDGIVFVVCR